MAEGNTSTTTSKTTPSTKDMLEAIKNIDSMSQGGFSKIASIARLALAGLESPEGYGHGGMDDIANALEAIWQTAGEAKNYINSEAEGVGANYVDEAERRRWAARAAHKS